VRGGRGRAADHDVVAVQVDRLDVHARSADEDGLPRVAEIGGAVALIGRSDTHDATVAGGERRRAHGVVADGGDDHHTLRPRVVDRVLKVRAEVGGAERHEDDVGPVIGGPQHAGDDVAVLALAVGVEHRDGEDLHAAIRHAGHALERNGVGLRGDDAGQPRAVATRVRLAVGAIEQGRAGQHLAGELLMGHVHAGVEHGDLGGARGRDDAEYLVPADPRQRPLVGVQRIVRDSLRRARLVELGVLHLRIGLVAGECRVDVLGCDGDDQQTQGRDRRGEGAAVALHDRRLLIRRESRDDLDDQ
jgi:hypothetical protein